VFNAGDIKCKDTFVIVDFPVSQKSGCPLEKEQGKGCHTHAFGTHASRGPSETYQRG
jgi:hypothetical protein